MRTIPLERPDTEPMSLPRGWTGTVKTAVLHAISLAIGGQGVTVSAGPHYFFWQPFPSCAAPIWQGLLDL
jgi:hypothetical protein